MRCCVNTERYRKVRPQYGHDKAPRYTLNAERGSHCLQEHGPSQPSLTASSPHNGFSGVALLAHDIGDGVVDDDDVGDAFFMTSGDHFWASGRWIELGNTVGALGISCTIRCMFKTSNERKKTWIEITKCVLKESRRQYTIRLVFCVCVCAVEVVEAVKKCLHFDVSFFFVFVIYQKDEQ